MVNDSVLHDDLTHIQNEPKTKSISLKYKIVLACMFGLCFFLYRLIYKKYIGNACNIDKYHQITYEANRKLYHGWDNTIIGIGQLLMDGWVIFMSLYWFWNIKNMRFPISAGVFFLFRAFMLNAEKFPFPQDIVWHNPGFFSLTVPYDHTRDFYYSGHTGTLTIIALELWTLQKRTICAVCVVSIMYMINMLTITRIHYSIDVVGAFIFAPFWYFFIEKHLKHVDFLFSTIFYMFRKLYNKCKGMAYYKYGSQADFEIKSDHANNNPIVTPIVKELQYIDVKLDMNEQITNSNDFPYLNDKIEDPTKSKIFQSN